MIEVSFRFYGQLNDFLRVRQRRRSFPHVLTAPASVKDVIEALGVPHPEVDVVVVNGDAEDFGYRLRDRDRIAVYPAFRSIDLAGLRRAGSNPPTPKRFVLDVHLGRLASLLRLVGFDSVVLDDDASLADRAARDGRIVLTRDVGLLKRSAVRHGYWVRFTHPELQLAEVVEQFDLVGGMQPFTRCTRCNTVLVPAAIDEIADRLPPRTQAAVRRFQRCPGCDRIYWEGSHYAALARVVDRARQRSLARRLP